MPNPYVQFTWVDGATAITAARLNNMELGINDASVQGYAAIAKPATPTTNAILYYNGSVWAQQLLLNANVAAGAALDVTKLALGAADQVLSSNGSANSWSGTTGANARVAVRKNSGGTTGTRRRLNFVEGSNIAITLADDAGNEEVAVTIAATTSIPAGVMWMTGATAAPTGWVLCDGTSYPRTGGTYDALFAAISTSYGSVDGTHFNVPDFKGRVPVGKGANAVVSTLGNNDGVVDANRRGTKHRHTGHNHGGNSGETASFWFAAGGFEITPGSGTSIRPDGISTVDGGSGVATDPLDGSAYLVVNYIIKL